MKYLSILFLIVLASCSESIEKKLQNKITVWVKSSLNDPNSYEPVKFSPLVTCYKKDLYKTDIWLYGEQIKRGVMIEYYQAKLDSIKPLAEAAKNDLTILKYIMGHEYRAKNGFGGVITKEEAFEFDTNFVMIER